MPLKCGFEMVTIALKLPVFSGWVLKPGFKARLFEFQASTSCRNANHLVLFRGFELWPPTQAALALRQHPPGPASCLDCAALPASHGVLTSASLHRQEVASQPRVVPRASSGPYQPAFALQAAHWQRQQAPRGAPGLATDKACHLHSRFVNQGSVQLWPVQVVTCPQSRLQRCKAHTAPWRLPSQPAARLT